MAFSILARSWVLSILTAVGANMPGDATTFSVRGRSINAWVPRCAAGVAKKPLVISLHAWGSNKDQQQSMDRLSDYVGRDCAVILYPQGLKRGHLFGVFGFAWNAGGCCPDADTAHVNDVAFFGDVITEAGKRFAIDENLVFVMGVSNGGMMANRLACSDTRIKAMVTVAGPLVNGTGQGSETESFQCQRRVPVLHFQGLADPVVPFGGCNKTAGGFQCQGLQSWSGVAPFPSAQEHIAAWRVRNNMPTADHGIITFKNGSATCTSWGGHPSNVTFCTLQHMGHSWPGRCNTIQWLMPSMFNCSFDIDASEQAMSFIRQFIPDTFASHELVV